jgi:hypothetical protein
MVSILEENKMKDDLWSEKYDIVKSEVEPLSTEEKKERLEMIAMELGIIANSFAGNSTGDIAVQLHKSSNATNKAIIMIKGDSEELRQFEFSEMQSLKEEDTYNMLKLANPGMFLNED